MCTFIIIDTNELKIFMYEFNHILYYVSGIK